MRNRYFSIFLLFQVNPFQHKALMLRSNCRPDCKIDCLLLYLDEAGSEYKATQTSVVNEQALKDAIVDFSNVIEDFKKQLPTKT